MSLFSPCLWLLPLLLLLPCLRLVRGRPLHLLLLLLLLPSVRIRSGPWLHLRPLLIMFLSRPFLRRPLGGPLQFLPPFICGTCSLNLLGDFLWVLSLLRVRWCDFITYMFYSLYLFVFVCSLSFPPSGDCNGSSALRGSSSSFVWCLLRPLWAVMSMVTSSLAYHLGSSYLWYCLSSMPVPCRVSPCGVAGRVSSSSVWPRCCGWGSLQRSALVRPAA